MSTEQPTHFFLNDVDLLPKTWYVDLNDDCDICRADTTADPLGNNDANISVTAVVRTKTCGHVFHEVCLHGWLQRRISLSHALPGRGTCPKCRVVLVTTVSELMLTSDERLIVMEAEMRDLREQLRARHEKFANLRDVYNATPTEEQYWGLALMLVDIDEMHIRIDEVRDLVVQALDARSN